MKFKKIIINIILFPFKIVYWWLNFLRINSN